MSANNVEDAKKLGTVIQNETVKHRKDPRYIPNGADKGYGVDYIGYDPNLAHLDEKALAMGELKKLYDARGNPNIQATYTATESDIESFRKLRNAEYLSAFDNMVSQEYLSKADPAQQQWLAQVYPEIYQRRIDEINRIAELQKRLAILEITGPRTKEDLEFIFWMEMNPDEKKKVEKAVHLGVGRATTGEDDLKVGWLNKHLGLSSLVPTHHTYTQGPYEYGRSLINGPTVPKKGAWGFDMSKR